MRVLVTNDDGIASPGLHHVAVALTEVGHEVVVAAPNRDCSGFGAAIGPLHLTGKVEFERVAIEGLAEAGFSVDGPPALCVLAAVMAGFGPRPEFVVSGINAGANTGRAVLHSGTVGAALTGLNFGLPGLAVSQVAPPSAEDGGIEWATAATLAAEMVERAAALRPPVVINLNVPNVTLANLSGTVAARLDPGGTVEATMIEREAGVLSLTMGGPPAARAGSDNALLEAGYATITALVGPHALALDLSTFLDERQRISA